MIIEYEDQKTYWFSIYKHQTHNLPKKVCLISGTHYWEGLSETFWASLEQIEDDTPNKFQLHKKYNHIKSSEPVSLSSKHYIYNEELINTKIPEPQWGTILRLNWREKWIFIPNVERRTWIGSLRGQIMGEWKSIEIEEMIKNKWKEDQFCSGCFLIL